MRWLPFFILAYVAVGVHLGLSGVGDVWGAQSNVVLLAAIFVALHAPRDQALLGCFVLGLIQDVVSLQPLGLWALVYGLVGWLVVSVQDVVYKEHPMTHFAAGLVGGLVAGAIFLGHGLLYPLFHKADFARHEYARPPVGPLFAGALYTALLAPLVLFLLQRTKKSFGFKSGRPTLQGRLTKGKGRD